MQGYAKARLDATLFVSRRSPGRADEYGLERINGVSFFGRAPLYCGTF
jgi:hypothetical protein